MVLSSKDVAAITAINGEEDDGDYYFFSYDHASVAEYGDGGRPKGTSSCVISLRLYIVVLMRI